MEKKLAGTERPYTWHEFLSIIRSIMEQQNVVMHDHLDYFDADWECAYKPIDLSVWDWHVVSETDFGGSEGIYSGFYVRMQGEPLRRIATAKTLKEGDDAYVAMHEFAARVCLAIRHYVSDHEDEFNWTGYDVGYMEGDKRVTYMLAHEHDNALKYARELKVKGRKAWLRDNAKRKYEDV